MVRTDSYTPTNGRYECTACGLRSPDASAECPECGNVMRNIAVPRE